MLLKLGRDAVNARTTWSVWPAGMWRILVVMGVVSATSQSATGAVSCLEYGTASLSGVLVRQTYPGPPDYESVTKGDEPRVIWVLLLDRRTCIYDSSSGYASRYGEREVQLVLDADRYLRYRNLLGKRVIVTGELIRGGARHEKRLVVIAREIARTDVRPL
jgi:Domain of unknown function (DUF4431)